MKIDFNKEKIISRLKVFSKRFVSYFRIFVRKISQVDKFKIVDLTKSNVKIPNFSLIFSLLFTAIISFFGVAFSEASPPFLRFVIRLIMAFLILKIWHFYIKNQRKKKASPKTRLTWFLLANNLYRKDTDSKGSYYSESAAFGWKMSETDLIIRAYKFGDSYTHGANSYAEGLSALFKLPLDNMKETVSYCDYIFKLKKDKRLEVVSAPLSYNHTTLIPLSENHSWNILKQPHLLLAGTTGSGKTTFINYLILEFYKLQADVYICDPKRSDLASLKNIIGEAFVASDPNNISKLTRICKEKMESRFRYYKEDSNKFVYGQSFVDYQLTPTFLIFDELGAFRAGADKKVFTETMANLSEIILKGREMGVFAVLATQQPNASNIPTELRDNLSVRLAMGNMSSEAYRMVFGENVDSMEGSGGQASGYIFLDGLGWSKPKFFKAPYLNYKTFNFIEELKKYQANIKRI